MDLAIEYYFDELEKLPRSCLFDRRKRQEVVEYLSVLIQGCSIGDDVPKEEAVRQTIEEIIKYHREKKTLYDTSSENKRKKSSSKPSKCMTENEHYLLYVALKLAFNFEVEDSQIIGKLIRAIYNCERNFDRLFSGALFYSKASHFLSAWKSDFENQEENFNALVFFMDHATRAKLDFQVTGRHLRFIDIPMQSCKNCTPLITYLQMALPNQLFLLLRYGAAVPHTINLKNVNALESILQRLVQCKEVYPGRLVSCLKLLLRCIPSIGIEFKDAKFRNVQRDVIVLRYEKLVRDELLPTNRCGFEPPELKHLCRCVIRKKLYQNFQLPYGISKLPVPEHLRSYLDIMED